MVVFFGIKTEIHLHLFAQIEIEMKRGLFICLTILCLATAACAQISLGVKVGPDIASTTTKFGKAKSTSNLILGWTGGLYAMVPLATELVFQPALLYQGKGGSIQVADGSRIKSKLHYISLPMDVLFMPVMPGGNGSWIVGLGPYVAYGLSGKQSHSTDDNSAEGDLFKYGGLKRTDAGINVQLGFELTNGINVSAFADIGLLNIASRGDHDHYQRNKTFSLTVGYTFN